MNRLHHLDYLRGLAAVGIMVYHYLSWTLGKFEAETLVGRLGIYGVSIFYVLSGLTLCHVYLDKMLPSKDDVLLFARKRFFRIFPLLWLVTLTSVVLAAQIPNFYNLLLNLSGLFGFIKWHVYFSPGVWSIGNELVFYVFFPFFILFTKASKLLMVVFSLVVLALYVFFAWEKLNPEVALSVQWKDYINPLNQLFLFLGGYLIGWFFRHVRMSNIICMSLVMVGLALFLWYPAQGDAIQLVTGVNRLVFTAACFLICTGLYKFSGELPLIAHKPLSLLGDMSYAVYLLHPLMYTLTGLLAVFLRGHHVSFSETARLMLSIGSTFIVGYIVYTYFERYFMAKATVNKTVVPNRLV